MPLNEPSPEWLEKRDAEWRAWFAEQTAARVAWTKKREAASAACTKEREAQWEAWTKERDAMWAAWAEDRDADHKAFTREIVEHNARMIESMISGLQEFTATLVAEIQDQRAQIQANTQAVLRALDRLGPEPT